MCSLGTETPPPLINYDNNNIKDPSTKQNRTSTVTGNCISSTTTVPNSNEENTETSNDGENQNAETDDYHKQDEQVILTGHWKTLENICLNVLCLLDNSYSVILILPALVRLEAKH